MQLIPADVKQKLLENGRLSASLADTEDEPDIAPVVKLFTPDGSCTWLLTEIDPDDNDIAFGLCDLGMGCPELGSIRISELESVRGRLGLKVERDLHFVAHKTLSQYADDARRDQSINA